MRVEKAFRLLAVLALALIARKLGSRVLGALALFSLLGLPFTYSNADAARGLREAGILPDVTEVRNVTLGFIERAMPLLEFNGQGRPRQPKEIAVMIQQVVPRLVTSPPGAGATTLDGARPRLPGPPLVGPSPPVPVRVCGQRSSSEISG